MNNNWISVEDRLPKPFESVLTLERYYIAVSYIDDDNIWVYRDHDYDVLPKYVTHWQPLPEPLAVETKNNF
jgi:hypothetical protein